MSEAAAAAAEVETEAGMVMAESALDSEIKTETEMVMAESALDSEVKTSDSSEALVSSPFSSALHPSVTPPFSSSSAHHTPLSCPSDSSSSQALYLLLAAALEL